MKFKRSKFALVASVVVVGALLGGATAASAATAYTSVSQWYSGNKGSWRAATSGTSQSWDFTGTCYYGVAGSATPEYAQMQLQRKNGVLPAISEGNKNVGCNWNEGARSWGTRSPGVQFRYQLNGVKMPGKSGLSAGPFSNSGITIKY